MLGDAFEKFGNMFLEIYELDPDRFLKIPELTLQWALRKTKVKLDLLTDTYMLFMVEKSIRGIICHALCRYVKAKYVIKKTHHKLSVGI